MERTRRRSGLIGVGASWLWVSVLAAASCSDSAQPEEAVTGKRAALERVGNCQDVEAMIRRQALREMNERMDQLAMNALQRGAGPNACQQVANARNAAATPTTAATASAMVATGSTVPAAAATGPSSAMASDTSTTNNQVAGVDEADFIKNDAKYVYAAVNGALRIIEAWPADSAHEVGKYELEGTPRKLFVEKDRALVYVTLPQTPPTAQNGLPSGTSFTAPRECTYGYDCELGGLGAPTGMLVFDISDRTHPQLLRRLELNGSLLAARRIGDAVHTVVTTPGQLFAGLSYNVPFVCGVNDGLDKQLAELETLRAANTAIIEKTPLKSLVPTVMEEGEDYAAVSCENVYRETVSTGMSFTTLVSLDMMADNAPAISTVVSRPGAVYASADALYLAVNQQKISQTSNSALIRPATMGGGAAMPVPARAAPSSAAAAPSGVTTAPSAASVSPVFAADATFSSALHKFTIGTDVKRTAYVASGEVKGHVLNQFSMDEHDAHLRVATSWGKVPSPSVHSTMSVLAQRGDRLELTGEVDDIAPGEDIRSVRFDGDRGFVVTFKKTDPLYAFDLSDPAAPKISGELKIPGFSTYMHMLDDDHLLTIGYDAADQGNFAYFTGVLLQIFDVSDMQDPKLAHKISIGTRGTSSEALTNHLAFTLFQDKLAVPMTICEGGSGQGMLGSNMTFSGLMLFDVSVEQGISERGRVAHPGTGGTYNNFGCTNWWSRAGSVVQRSVFMDDFVYSIANDVIRVQNLDALGSDVAEVPLQP